MQKPGVGSRRPHWTMLFESMLHVDPDGSGANCPIRPISLLIILVSTIPLAPACDRRYVSASVGESRAPTAPWKSAIVKIEDQL